MTQATTKTLTSPTTAADAAAKVATNYGGPRPSVTVRLRPQSRRHTARHRALAYQVAAALETMAADRIELWSIDVDARDCIIRVEVAGQDADHDYDDDMDNAQSGVYEVLAALKIEVQ